jgi:hypothetical protein
MKLSLSLSLAFTALAFSLCAFSAHAAAEPVDVQLNNSAFRGVLEEALNAKRAQYRLVKTAGPAHFLKVTVTQDLSHGASCQVALQADVNGMTASSTMSRESSFVFSANRAAYCQKAVASMLEQELGWVL